jgi:hypothetical protein
MHIHTHQICNIILGPKFFCVSKHKRKIDSRVIHKVRKTQHKNPEFDHTEGEIQKKKPAKKYLSIQGGMKLKKPSILVVKLSFILSFLFPELLPPLLLNIFSLLLSPNCRTISVEPCALNAEFQHFILRFNKNVFTLQIPLKEGIGSERRPKDRVKTGLLLQITRVFIKYC